MRELGGDLLQLTLFQRWTTVLLPFLCVVAYVTLACMGWWAAAVLALAAFSFVSYGSTSHDLVHRNLGLSRTVNDVLLSLIELSALRSSRAYRASHLHHHARFPHDDDVEGRSGRSLLSALIAGPTLQFRLWLWALQHAPKDRTWLVVEGAGCMALAMLAAAAAPSTKIPIIYVCLVVMGGWVFPFATVYLPHDHRGANVLQQTRAFRGKAAAILFNQHLYHLEHHLYPAVPHHHWPALAERLDPFLERAGVVPIRLLF